MIGASSGPHIRSATPADAQEVARLCAQWGYPVSGNDARGRIDRLLSSTVHTIQVAEQDGRLIGWITGEVRISLGSDPRAEITGLVVDSDARRSGVGSLLVASVEGWAAANGCHEMFLRSSVARTEAHPFYERLGFRRTKTQHAYNKVLTIARQR
jgi:GNAT superfamily N-acetyltransferase